MKRSGETLVVAGLVGLVAYAVLSNPKCQSACQSVFQPIASEARKLFASAAVGLLVANLA